jgi:hypothetical protein
VSALPASPQARAALRSLSGRIFEQRPGPDDGPRRVERWQRGKIDATSTSATHAATPAKVRCGASVHSSIRRPHKGLTQPTWPTARRVKVHSRDACDRLTWPRLGRCSSRMFVSWRQENYIQVRPRTQRARQLTPTSPTTRTVRMAWASTEQAGSLAGAPAEPIGSHLPPGRRRSSVVWPLRGVASSPRPALLRTSLRAASAAFLVGNPPLVIWRRRSPATAGASTLYDQDPWAFPQASLRPRASRRAGHVQRLYTDPCTTPPPVARQEKARTANRASLASR